MVEINDKNYEIEVVKHKGKVVLDVWAPWCGPCLSFKPVFNAAEGKHPDYKFCTANADEFNAMDLLNVEHVPSVIVFDNGKEVMRGGVEVLEKL